MLCLVKFIKYLILFEFIKTFYNPCDIKSHKCAFRPGFYGGRAWLSLLPNVCEMFLTSECCLDFSSVFIMLLVPLLC